MLTIIGLVTLYLFLMTHTCRVLTGHLEAGGDSLDPPFTAFMFCVFLPPVALVMALLLSYGPQNNDGKTTWAIEPRRARKARAARDREDAARRKAEEDRAKILRLERDLKIAVGS